VDDVGGTSEHGVGPLKLTPQQVRAIRADCSAEVMRVLEGVFDAEQVALCANALSPVAIGFYDGLAETTSLIDHAEKQSVDRLDDGSIR
jgi:hypothetical protein